MALTLARENPPFLHMSPGRYWYWHTHEQGQAASDLNARRQPVGQLQKGHRIY